MSSSQRADFPEKRVFFRLHSKCSNYSKSSKISATHSKCSKCPTINAELLAELASIWMPLACLSGDYQTFR